MLPFESSLTVDPWVWRLCFSSLLNTGMMNSLFIGILMCEALNVNAMSTCRKMIPNDWSPFFVAAYTSAAPSHIPQICNIYIYPVKMNIHINNSQLYKWLILHFPLWKVSIYKHQKLDEKLDNHTTLNPAAQGLKLCPAQGRCFSCTFQWWPRQDLWHWLRTQNKCREFVFRGARSKVGGSETTMFLVINNVIIGIITIVTISQYHHHYHYQLSSSLDHCHCDYDDRRGGGMVVLIFFTIRQSLLIGGRLSTLSQTHKVP